MSLLVILLADDIILKIFRDIPLFSIPENMDSLLHYLNSADLSSLTKVSGVPMPVAEGLINARPFDSVDDCLKVKGMGRNLLARIETTVEEIESDMDHSAMIPAGQEAMPMEANQTAPQKAMEDKPSFRSRLGNALLTFLRALLRLILVVLVIGVVGAAVYFGLPVLRERFIAPVEQNTARVTELENEVADLKTQLVVISNRLDEIEPSIEAHTASLEKLESVQATLETQLKENKNETLLKLKQEVMMTRALDMLARARLYLAQSNFGLAREDVQSARDLLAELQSEANDEILAQAMVRLEFALGNLPAFPVVAAGDLEIAWQILMSGELPATATLPAEPSPTITPTQIPTLEATATP